MLRTLSHVTADSFALFWFFAGQGAHGIEERKAQTTCTAKVSQLKLWMNGALPNQSLHRQRNTDSVDFPCKSAQLIWTPKAQTASPRGHDPLVEKHQSDGDTLGQQKTFFRSTEWPDNLAKKLNRLFRLIAAKKLYHPQEWLETQEN